MPNFISIYFMQGLCDREIYRTNVVNVGSAINRYTKGIDSVSFWNDNKVKIEVSSEGLSTRRAVARNVDFYFVVLGSERTYKFHLRVKWLSLYSRIN